MHPCSSQSQRTHQRISKTFCLHRRPQNAEFTGIFLLGSKFSHSCAPNASWAFDAAGHLQYRAIRPIAPLEVLTFSYVGNGSFKIENVQAVSVPTKHAVNIDMKAICFFYTGFVNLEKRHEPDHQHLDSKTALSTTVLRLRLSAMCC